jgi:hypothetical protein
MKQRMARIKIQIHPNIKSKLDALRAQGTTASGFIRSLLEQHFNHQQPNKKGR